MKKWGVLAAVAALAVVAASGTAHGAMGVGVVWDGNGGITPNMVLPIQMESGLLIEPMLGFDKIDENYLTITETDGGGFLAAQAKTSLVGSGTEIRAGVRVEKAAKMEGASPLIGGYGMLILGSPDDYVEGGTTVKLDTYTDFSFGVFVGGSAPLANGVDIVGVWGPTVDMFGKRKASTEGLEAETESATNFGSRASLSLRFWLWGIR
ncbi:MAG: hypothetical protein AB1792_03625 [Candidatus Zixiibacteriota bacterium]